MNYMKDIAKMLGLELNETFRIKGEEGIYMITENGLLFEGDGLFNIEDETVFVGILKGEYEVSKMPWKPRDRGNYWCLTDVTSKPFITVWSGANIDFYRWKAGNCFRTKEEVEAKGKEVLEKLRKEYEEE